VYYTLPSDLGKLLDIRQTRDDIKLHYIPIRNLDRYVADRTQTGEPEYYTFVGQDSSNLYRLEFFPVPDVKMNLNVRYYRVVAELSSDSDVPLIPTQFHDILIWDVLGTYGYNFMDDTRINFAKAEANRIMEDMKKNDLVTENIAVREAFDVNPSSSDTEWLRRMDLPIE
jgi:hypothetical protein